MNTHDLVPILETERLILRGHQTSDFPASAAMWANPQVVAHISGTPSTTEQSWSRLLRYTGHWHHVGYGYWAVQSKANGRFIGEVGFADYQRDTEPSFDGKPEAGWVLDVHAHGQGFATEALRAALAWADENLAATHTRAMFDPKHAASINVARKLGFGNDIFGHYGTQDALFLERARHGSV